MNYHVTVQQAPARHLAVVRDRRRWADLGPKLLALLDRVYAAVRAGHVTQTGHNVFVFRDRSPDQVTVEIGVEVAGPFAAVEGVVAVATPAAEVASTVHRGPYSGLGAAHAAVIGWCARHGRTRADVWWEIYGDGHDDPARLETEVVYALVPEQVVPLLFSYGTLQEERVQLSTFGRRLSGTPDALPGYERSTVKVEDARFVASSGRAEHANVVPTDRDDSRVAGMVFEVTDAELAAADRYEAPAAYVRTPVRLESGREAWLYVHASTLLRSRA